MMKLSDFEMLEDGDCVELPSIMVNLNPEATTLWVNSVRGEGLTREVEVMATWDGINLGQWLGEIQINPQSENSVVWRELP